MGSLDALEGAARGASAEEPQRSYRRRVTLWLIREGLPIAGAFGMFVHLCSTSLVPHLADRDELLGHRQAALDEQAQLERELDQLQVEAAALEDPVYRERMRRVLSRAPSGQRFVPTDEVIPKK